MKSRPAMYFRLFIVLLSLCLVFISGGCSSDKTNSDTAQEDKEYILIGRVAPLTGAIANFGAGTPFIEEKAIEAINAEGGIFIEEYGKKLPLKIVVVDSESSSTKASEAATKLILDNKIDVMIASHTADTVNPVAAICERYQVPCITVDAPADMWLEGGPYKYNFHAFFDTESEINGFAEAWDKIDTNKKVGIVCANDTEGISFAEAMVETAVERGYTPVDPGRFTSGTNDFTSLINKLIQEDVEIITGAVLSPDFAVFWRQAHNMGFIPKICAIDKANLFVSDVKALGDDLGNGVLAEAWWRPECTYSSSLTGQTSQELSDMYLQKSGLEISPPPIGFKHANVELLVDALKRAQTLKEDKLLEAIGQTDMDTIVGHIKFDEEHKCILGIAIGQWVLEDGTWKQNIVANKYVPHIPLTGDGMVPVPGSK